MPVSPEGVWPLHGSSVLHLGLHAPSAAPVSQLPLPTSQYFRSGDPSLHPSPGHDNPLGHTTLTVSDTEFPLLPTPEPEASWPLLHPDSLPNSSQTSLLMRSPGLAQHGPGVTPLAPHTHLLHNLQDLVTPLLVA